MTVWPQRCGIGQQHELEPTIQGPQIRFVFYQVVLCKGDAVAVLGFVAEHGDLLAKRDREGRASDGFLQPQRRSQRAPKASDLGALLNLMAQKLVHE